MITRKKSGAKATVEVKPSGKTAIPPPKRREGRPTLYSEELVEEICDRIANGETLLEICAEDAMPERTTVLKWLKLHDSFSTRYREARQYQGDHTYDSMAGLEKGVIEGTIDPQAAKVVLWSRQWRAARTNARNYSEKTITELTGKDGGAIKVETTVLNTDLMTPEELDAMEKILLAAKARKEAGDGGR